MHKPPCFKGKVQVIPESLPGHAENAPEGCWKPLEERRKGVMTHQINAQGVRGYLLGNCEVYWRSSGRKVLAKRKQETLLNILSVPHRVLGNCSDPGIQMASPRKCVREQQFRQAKPASMLEPEKAAVEIQQQWRKHEQMCSLLIRDMAQQGQQRTE
jgi:hypothetical protein